MDPAPFVPRAYHRGRGALDSRWSVDDASYFVRGIFGHVKAPRLSTSTRWIARFLLIKFRCLVFFSFFFNHFFAQQI